MISRDVPVPPYRQLAAIIRRQITAGELSGRLPGERYMAQEYDVALGTVRKALGLLVDEGLVEKVHGLGSFVIREAPPQRGG